MKLRNKKTGKMECVSISTFSIDGKDRIELSVYDFNSPSFYRCIASYSSLVELMDEWEDYKPAEPLIKDEKVRKAIRAWAEVNSIEGVIYTERSDRSFCRLTDMGVYDFDIEIVGWIPTLKGGEEYTINKLCGEEE